MCGESDAGVRGGAVVVCVCFRACLKCRQNALIGFWASLSLSFSLSLYLSPLSLCLHNADTLFTVKWKNFKWKTPGNWPNCRAIKSHNA